jgi:hypothetical protein
VLLLFCPYFLLNDDMYVSVKYTVTVEIGDHNSPWYVSNFIMVFILLIMYNVMYQTSALLF